MKTPMPPIHETPEERKALLTAEREAQKYPRLQALSRLQTRQARTRRQVAHLLGGHREIVGRWLAAYASGGLPQLLTMAKAPGKVPRLSPALPQALRDRLRQPHGFASYQAVWPWLRQDYGLALAYNTVHKFVRDTLRANLQGPRQSPIKNTLKGSRPFRRLFHPSCRRQAPRARPGGHHRLSALGASVAKMNVALGGCRCHGDASP